MTTTQAHALERLIIALDGHPIHVVLEVTSSIARIPGRTGLYLDALAVVDDATLAKLAREGVLLELANAPRMLSSIIENPAVALGLRLNS